MSTAARSGLRVRSNVTRIWLVPSFPLVDVMYFIPSAPLICCSSGIVTALSTVCALAPMYTLETPTCGGARLGNCAIGNDGITAAPANTISIAQTLANTGRRMKKLANMQDYPSTQTKTADDAGYGEDIQKCFSRWQALPFVFFKYD